jgi:hypothetical protein
MVRAWAGTAAVILIPGALIATLARLRMRSVSTWAAIPGFSLAAVFVAAQVIDLLGVPFNVTSVAICVIVLAAATYAVARVRTRGLAPRAPDVATTTESPARAGALAARDRGAPPAREAAERHFAFGMLLAGIAAGLLIFAVGIGSHGRVPPEVDASNHGFFVARVIHSESVDVSKVVVSDPSGAHGSASFYPLGMHASAAIAARISGADVGRVLVAFDIVFACIVLPLGMYSLARALAHRRPLIAGFTALAVPTLVLFPVASIGFGDVPLVMGMALVPITVVTMRRALADGVDGSRAARISAIVAAGLLLFAATVVHTSQVPLILMLTALLLLEQAWRTHSVSILRACVGPALAVAAVVVILLAPTLKRVVSGVSERSSIFLTTRVSTASAVRRIATLQTPQPPRQLLLAALVFAGVAIWLWRRRPAWVVGYVILAAITVLVWVSNGALSKLVGVPWYHSTARLSFNQAFFAPFFAGVALAAIVDAFVGRDRARSSPRLAVACLAVAVVFAATVGYNAYRSSTDLLRDSFEANARVTPDSEAAFSWLHQHAAGGDVVVNDVNADGSLWMYALDDVPPLFAVQPISTDRAAQADWNARKYIVQHINRLGVDPRVDALLRRFHARWVYFDERLFGLFRHTMQLDALEHNPRLQIAFERGTVHVFRITAAPAAG